MKLIKDPFALVWLLFTLSLIYAHTNLTSEIDRIFPAPTERKTLATMPVQKEDVDWNEIKKADQWLKEKK